MEILDLYFRDVQIHWFDVSLIIVYLIGLTVFGYVYSKRVSSSSDYFLASRSLSWWVIGLSIIGTNIGSNDYVGAAGGAFKIGIAQANFEWIGAIPAMILSAFVFIPFYWRAGVYSIPEYLGKRYNQTIRLIVGIILSTFSMVVVGVFLWATALMLQTYMGWPIWFSVLVTSVVVGFYTISGGLAAVAITDTIQLFIMFLGAIALTILGIEKVGGIETFAYRLQTEFPEHLNAFLPSTHEEFPWPGVLLGLGLVLSPAYWCANQAILQRTLAAKSEWDGRASMILAAMAKSFVPFLIVIPGFIALLLNTGEIKNPDKALPWVIKNVLPPGLSGLLFVSFIAALQSSVDSTLNSASTMITRDIVGVLKKEKMSDGFEFKLGRVITFIVLIFGIFFVPVVAFFSGIYVFLQQVLSFFQGPILALTLWGILSKRITSSSALFSLLMGLSLSIILSFLGLNMLYIAFWSFIFSSSVLFFVSTFTKPKDESELKNLTYTTTTEKINV